MTAEDPTSTIAEQELRPTRGLRGNRLSGVERSPEDLPEARARTALQSFVSNTFAMVALGVLVAFVVFCFLGPHVYHSNQVLSDLENSNLPPGPGHPVGTDANGFDELGRIMLGGQASLEIAFLSAAIATIIGTLYGAVSGLAGGRLDGLMMRIIDIFLSIPFLLLVLIVATKYHPSILTMSLVLGIFTWFVPARLVRGEVLSLGSRDFIAASRVMGASPSSLVFRHFIPNALGVIAVNVTFQVADAIIILSFMGFLGFGLQFPLVSWGDMLGQANIALSNDYWWLVYPVGAAIVLVVMACNLVGDGLRDAVDVRLRRR